MEWIGHIITLLLVIIAFAVAWGKISNKVETMATECLKYREGCQNNNKTELERLAVLISDLIKQKEHRWEELDKTLSSIDKFMGRVDQYMVMKNGTKRTV